MRPGRLLHIPTAIVLDALAVCLLAAVVLGLGEAIRQEYAQAGLVHQILYGISDRARQFVLPVLALFGVAALVTGLGSRLRRRGRGPFLAGVAGALVLLATLFPFRRALARGAVAVVPELLAPTMADLYRVVNDDGPLSWAVIAVAALALAWRRLAASRSSLRPPAVAAVLLLLLVGGAMLERRVHHRRHPGRRNIVLVVLDTVGASHLAGYGYHRETAPEIERLAAGGMLFANSFAVAPWTLPSHASMFTGLLPIQHHATQENLLLDHRLHTLAELLREDGYRTMAVVNNPVISTAANMDQGFEAWFPMWHHVLETGFGRGARHATNRVVEEMLDSLESGDRFFLFLNYVEAHAPYEPPAAFRDRFRRDDGRPDLDPWWHRYYTGLSKLSAEDFAVLNDLYDGELAYLSDTIGDLVKLLESRGMLDDTLIILTSDHGENLGDHGHLDHVFNVYDTLLRVPLILLGPGVPRGRDDAPTSSVDIFHTALGAAEVEPEQFSAGGEGRNLLDGAGPEDRPPLVAEYYTPHQTLSVVRNSLDEAARLRMAPYLRRLRAVRHDGWKLIWGSDGSRELYHVAEDPEEQLDRASSDPERVLEMTAMLEQRLRELSDADFRLDTEPPPEEIEGYTNVDAETLERLRALGYVQ